VDIEDVEQDNIENSNDNLFDEPPTSGHKSSAKDKNKSDDAPKPLHPKNRNAPTVEL